MNNIIDFTKWDMQTTLIGNEQEKILVIDNFFVDPIQVVDEYTKSTFDLPQRLYPGIRANLPEPLNKDIQEKLSPILIDHFQCEPVKFSIWFSQITTEEADLSTQQILPHVDCLNDTDVAFIVYLFDQQFGGTNFYRQISTGYESLTHSTLSNYTTMLNRELNTNGHPEPKYVSNIDHIFQKIHTVEGKFNRCILYKQNHLHNADVHSIENDRKTITGFVRGKK